MHLNESNDRPICICYSYDVKPTALLHCTDSKKEQEGILLCASTVVWQVTVSNICFAVNCILPASMYL